MSRVKSQSIRHVCPHRHGKLRIEFHPTDDPYHYRQHIQCRNIPCSWSALGVIDFDKRERQEP